MATPATPEDLETENDALQKWGYMIKHDKRPSPNLDRLLRGIAEYISSHFGQADHNDLVPSQLAAFYKAVGGDYDPLFLEMPPQSIAFIYKALGCLHSLQPIDSDGNYAPCIPALKPRGFVHWQTIQVLLGPEEHVPFLQNALRMFDILDPETGYPLAKTLPASAFPAEPDPAMEAWHHSVSERLRLEAEQGEQLQINPTSERSPNTDVSVNGSAEERANAANYFSNPFNRNREGKPGIVTQIKQAPAKVFQGGKMVATSFFQGGKMVADPKLFSRRKSSNSNRSASAEASTDRRHASNHSNTHPSTHHDRSVPSSSRHGGSGSRRSPRRYRSPSSSSSDSTAGRNPPRRMRRYMSHDTPPRSPQISGYPPDTGIRLERSASSRGRTSRPEENQPGNTFRPSGSPPMAARIPQGYGHIPPLSQRTSSEHRSVYEKPHVVRPRYNNTNESYDRRRDDYRSTSNTRASRVSSYPQPYQTQPQTSHPRPDGYERQPSQDMLRPPLHRYTSENKDREPESDHGRRKSFDAGRGVSGPRVNGVGGRRYPNETPWE